MFVQGSAKILFLVVYSPLGVEGESHNLGKASKLITVLDGNKYRADVQDAPQPTGN